MIKDRISTLDDIVYKCQYFFCEPRLDSEEAVRMRLELMKKFGNLSATYRIIYDNLDASFDMKLISEKIECKSPDLYLLMRYAVTGSRVGASVIATCKTIGIDAVQKRLLRASVIAEIKSV